VRASLEAAIARVHSIERCLEAPYGFVPPLVLERLKQEAQEERARLEEELQRCVGWSTCNDVL
jgi:hypothetical protein